jgi:thiamine-phosphate pyrophosphorylase
MASAVARARLARAARRLNAGCGLPALLLLTDTVRAADPRAAMRLLPRGAAVILRHADDAARERLAEMVQRIARERGLVVLVAGDAALAVRVDADGLHLPEARLREAGHWKALRPFWFVTASAHSLRALGAAGRAGADAVLLGPAFPTESHRERQSLGPCRFRRMAALASLPIYALGGVNGLSVQRLVQARLAGIAAIEGLLPDHSA